MKQGISRQNSQNHKAGGSPPTTPVVFPDLQRFAKHASRTLVIRDLPYSCKNDHLRQFLEVEHNFQVECVHVCYDRKNQSLHYGYALFLSDEMAKDALNKLQGQRMWGRDLRLQPFDPLTPSQTSISGVIHVFFRAQSAQLPLITEATLRQFLESFGEIEHLVIRHHDFDRHDNRQSGFGFVTFLDEAINSHVAQTVRARHHQQVTYDCSWSRRHDPGATQGPTSSVQTKTEATVEPPKASTPTLNLSQSHMNSLSVSPMPQSPLQSWVSSTSGSGYSSHSTSRAGSFTGVSVSSPVGTPSATLSTTVTMAATMAAPMAQNKAPVMTTPHMMNDPSTAVYVSMPPPPMPMAPGTYYVNGNLSSSPMYSFAPPVPSHHHAHPHPHHHHPSSGPMVFSTSPSVPVYPGYAAEIVSHGQAPPPPPPALSLPTQAMRMYPAPSPYPPQQHQQQQHQQQQQQPQSQEQGQQHSSYSHSPQQMYYAPPPQQQHQHQQQHPQQPSSLTPMHPSHAHPMPHHPAQASYVYPAAAAAAASFSAQQSNGPAAAAGAPPMATMSSSPPAYPTTMLPPPAPHPSMVMIPSHMPMPHPSTVYYTY